MEENWLVPIMEEEQKTAFLCRVNRASEGFGLSLEWRQMEQLLLRHAETLHGQMRVEFGEGPLRALAFAFCDSAFVFPESWAETLGELQEAFDLLKAELPEDTPDEMLIRKMRAVFEGAAHGDVRDMAERIRFPEAFAEGEDDTDA